MLKSKELPDDPVKRCGYFFLSLPTCHPFTDCCADHDDAYGNPIKTSKGAWRRIWEGETYPEHRTQQKMNLREMQRKRIGVMAVDTPWGVAMKVGLPTRKEVDLKFLNCMLETIERKDLNARYYKPQAYTMYWIVRAVGGLFWPR